MGEFTCLPIMPMQAIDGVVMVGIGEKEVQVGLICQAELLEHSLRGRSRC